MIFLLLAIAVGFVAGWVRAHIKGRPYRVPALRWVWIVPVAFLPQFLAFFFPATRSAWSTTAVAAGFVVSQVLLLLFAWVNRRLPGFWLLGLGLSLNLIVIVLNGGLMPIAPETATTLFPEVPVEQWEPGQRLGTTKDVVLPRQQTRLWPLSDWLVTPDWMPYRTAFSPGDVLIACGVFWLMWSLGGGNSKKEHER